MTLRLPISTPFPYTTLFRSVRASTRMGEPIGRFCQRWLFIPDDFVAWPDRVPPATGQATKSSGINSQRSEEHTSELQSHSDLVCRLLLEKKKTSLTTNAELT